MHPEWHSGFQCRTLARGPGELSFNVPTLGALYQDATWRLIDERRRAVAGAIAYGSLGVTFGAYIH
jgi:hypothetical protein